MAPPLKPPSTKYETLSALAKHGMNPESIIELTMVDVVANEKSTSIRGAKLTMDEAKTFALYLHEFGSGMKQWLFYGLQGKQCALQGIKRGLADHLRKYHRLKLSDIGWVEPAATPKPPLVINDYKDIQRIVDELREPKKA